MLSSNHICQVQSQNFKIMQQQYLDKHIFDKGVISVLMPLRTMLAENPKMTYQFASEAYKLFIAKGLCKQSDWEDSYEQLALYGVALSSLFFTYDMAKGALALYTSSIGILQQLATQGLLKGKKEPIAIELQNFTKVLVDSQRIKDSIKKGDTIQAVRLDFELVGNNVIFTGTVPKSQLNFLKDPMITFQSMNVAMEYINQILQDKLLKVTMGDKVRIVTKNYQLLSMIYGEARARFLISRGYDPRIESFYVPSVGASIYTAGITNLKLTNIDNIQVLPSIEGVDLSEIRLDYSMAKDFFIKSVKKMKANDIHKLADRVHIFNPNLNATESKEMILTVPESMFDRDVYNLMKSMPDLFNIDEYKKLPCKYGTDFETLNVPTTQKELEELLKTGVFKVLITKRKGDMSTIICSNSPSELARIYGKDYYRIYESEGNRLKALSFNLRDKTTIAKDEVNELCTKFGVEFIYTNLIINLGELPTYKVKDINGIVNGYMNDIENRKTVISQPHLITVRSCEAKVAPDGTVANFYKNIDIKSVVSVIRLSSLTRRKPKTEI